MTTQYNTFQYEIFCIQVQAMLIETRRTWKQRLITDYVPHIIYPKRGENILCGSIVIEKEKVPETGACSRRISLLWGRLVFMCYINADLLVTIDFRVMGKGILG